MGDPVNSAVAADCDVPVPAEPASLAVDGRVVAAYNWRPDLPISMAPRPFLHPVRTVAGTVVTEAMPTSHRHHLGVSVAVADVDGNNFWGSRTFIPGHGPAWLDNHGTQQHVRWIRRTATHLSHSLRWMSIDREHLLSETRTLSAEPLSPDQWALTWESALVNTSGRDLRIQSPAGLGRVGAGFGGFFWRAPTGRHRCRVAAVTGEDTEAVHGTRSPWLVVSAADEHRKWTLLFIAASRETREDRWFLRTRDYVGIGSALSWDRPLVLPAGAPLARRIVVVVADGAMSAEGAAVRAADFAA
jgi:Methane oxygenase PmoA